jgi:hypothetical protein
MQIGLERAALASAEDYVVSSGVRGGHYHSVGSRLVTLLREDRLIAMHLTSTGSLDNLTLLADAESPVNVVLAQADALRFYLDEHPAFSEQVVILDDVGRECVALVTKSDGGISSAADLKSGDSGQLVLPGPGSGPAVTFEYMRRMEPAYRNCPVVHRDPIQAMLQMRMPDDEEIAAVMLVKRPRTLSPEIEIVLENRADFRIAPIRADDVRNGKLPDGSPVYSFEEVRTGVGSDFSVSYETMCTRALILTSTAKSSAPSRRELGRILLKSSDFIAPSR